MDPPKGNAKQLSIVAATGFLICSAVCTQCFTDTQKGGIFIKFNDKREERITVSRATVVKILVF